MNKAEKTIKEKYEKQGYKCLHNCGFCDFIFFKVVDNKPTGIIFCEVKSKKDRLRYEQQVFKNVIETLGLNYKIEVVDAHTIPNHSRPCQTIPHQTIPPQIRPVHPMPIQTIPNQVKKVINNEDEIKIETP